MLEINEKKMKKTHFKCIRELYLELLNLFNIFLGEIKCYISQYAEYLLSRKSLLSKLEHEKISFVSVML